MSYRRWLLPLLTVFGQIIIGPAAIGSADASEPSDGADRLLPRISPDVQLSRPSGLAQILLAQEGEVDTQRVAISANKRPGAKSPGRAFFLSAAVPGLGELWAGSKTRAAVFFGLEVLGLGLYSSWDSKGNDLEDEFRVRADSTYNPWNYLAWRDSRNSRFSSITHALPCSSYVKASPSSVPVPDAIRDCEAGEKQQFYELIGKYDQFVSGWEDVYDPDTGNRIESTEVDSAENFQSEIRLSYEVDRNESNKYLKRASNMLGLILVNHVISSIDAVRVARARNEGLDEAIIDRRTRFGLALGGSAGTTPLFMAYRPLE